MELNNLKPKSAVILPRIKACSGLHEFYLALSENPSEGALEFHGPRGRPCGAPPASRLEFFFAS